MEMLCTRVVLECSEVETVVDVPKHMQSQFCMELGPRSSTGKQISASCTIPMKEAITHWHNAILPFLSYLVLQ